MNLQISKPINFVHISNCVAVGKKWSWLRILFSIPFVYRICLYYGYKAKAKVLVPGRAWMDGGSLHITGWVVQPPWKMAGFNIGGNHELWGYSPSELMAMCLA